MEFFVIDTNIFFNMEAGLSLGKKTEDVVVNLTKTAQKLKNNKTAIFYMTPKAVEEFLSFFENKEQPFLKEFLSTINIQTPDLMKTTVPSQVFYKLIDDIRNRSYRGMNIAEEEILRAANEFSGMKIAGKKEFQIKVGGIIKKFRDRYRNATRTGFIDSVTDLEIILLAKETNAFLVSTDEGVLDWGRALGIKEMPSLVFAKRLESLLQSRQG